MSHQISPAELELATKEQLETKSLGFWIYLMTDCILFASLFATYIVLLKSTNGGATGRELFDLPFVLLETMVLLVSSFVCGMMVLAARAGRKQLTLIALVVTFLLGATFLGLELSEFTKLANEGHGWWTSGFLSGFFTLVATHGLHIAVGLLWIGVMVWQLYRRGFTAGVSRRLVLFSLFWHFLDVIWIFIFTVVYLIGVS